jgi:hypothetical protein
MPADIPQSALVISQFQGTNYGVDQFDPETTAKGLARDSRNVQVNEPNRLAVRPGVRVVSFSSTGP